MASVRIIRFSKASLLRRIDPALFLDFTRSFEGFLTRCEVTLPAEPVPESIPYAAIAESFMKLDAVADKDLIDALYYLDSLSADANADLLLDEARTRGFVLPEGDLHPVDVAVRVWLQPDGPNFLRFLQDRNTVKKFRSFQFCQRAEGKTGEYVPPLPDAVTEIEGEMRPVFLAKKRGDECVVTSFDEADEVWFVIRHGEIMNRGESVEEGGETGVIVFRPVTHDVVVYNKETHEIRTNVDGKWQLDLYRWTFGRLIFKDGDYFGALAKYTMAPLRTRGAASLACPEVEEIEWIKLKEVEVMFGGGKDWERVKYRGADLFPRWAAGDRPFPSGSLVQAGFSVKFRDSKDPRTVSIRSSTKLVLSRDHDGEPVERWLRLRHFNLDNPEPE